MKLLNTKEINDYFGITEDALQNLPIVADENGLFDSVAIIQASIIQSSDSEDLPDRKREEALLIKARRIGMDQKNDIARGDCISILDGFERPLVSSASAMVNLIEVIYSRIRMKFPQTDEHLLKQISAITANARNRIADDKFSGVNACD